MTATYTFDVFSSLDGYGSHVGDWVGYWGSLDGCVTGEGIRQHYRQREVRVSRNALHVTYERTPSN